MLDGSDSFTFICSGRGKGEFEAPGEGGDRFLLKLPEGGGFLQEREGPRGEEGVCGELGNLGGGGAEYFLGGPKCPPSPIRGDFQEGVRTATFQLSESGGSLNGPDPFTELPFL